MINTQDPRFQILSQLKNGNNPQQIVMNMLQKQAMNNPMAQNFMQLANSFNTQGMEQIVRNMYKERGLDFDNARHELEDFFR